MPDLPILDELRGDLDRAYRRRETKRRRLPRHALVPAFAAAAAAALAVVTFQGSGGATVEALAATAAAQPPAAAPGKFAYFRTERRDWSTEWWVAADGSGRLLQHSTLEDFERPLNDAITVARPANDRGAGRWRVTGRPRAGWRTWTRDVSFGPGEFDRVHAVVGAYALELDVTRLPADPTALEADLRAKLAAAARDDDPENGFAGRYEPSQLLTVIEQYLRHPLAAPAVRSALLQVAAGIDGMKVIEDVRDPGGRPATMLSYERELHPGGGFERTELFFDRDTSASLGSRTVGDEGGDMPYEFEETYAPLATVDSTRARP